MFAVDPVIIVWTVISAVTVAFTGAMAVTRNRNLTALKRVPVAERDDEYDFRVWFAKQDIRRSLVRYCSSICSLVVGVVHWTSRTGHFPSEYQHVMRYWPWVLIGMIALILLNEVLDRWALHSLRQRYRRLNP